MSKDITFVIDANVLISAFLFSNSKPRQALDKAQDIGIILLSSTSLLELSEVLARPKFDRYISIETRKSLINTFKQTAIMIEPKERITECRDAKDNKYLELAVSGQAQYIITGDKDLLSLNPFRGISIVTVQDFLTKNIL